MKICLLAVAVLAGLPHTAQAAPANLDPKKLSDGDLCRIMSDGAGRANAAMPRTIDGNTTATGIFVDCAGMRYETRYSLAVDRAAVTDAWQENVRGAMAKAVCPSNLMGEMARRGWTFASRYRFNSGEPMELAVTCPRN